MRKMLTAMAAAFGLSGCASTPAPVFCELTPPPGLMSRGAPVPQIDGEVAPHQLRGAYYRAVAHARNERRKRHALQDVVRDHQATCARLRRAGGL